MGVRIKDETVCFLGKPVSEREMALIREVLGTYSGLSRMELAATVCELLGFTRGNGKPKARECREWLEELESKGRLALPAKRSGRPVGSKTSVPERTVVPADITGSISDVGPIRVERVQDGAGRAKFRELIGHYHYLGYRVPYGAQLRYLVYGGRGDVLACLLFTSAAWRCPRDDNKPIFSYLSETKKSCSQFSWCEHQAAKAPFLWLRLLRLPRGLRYEPHLPSLGGQLVRP